MLKKAILFFSILLSSGLLFAAEPGANKIKTNTTAFNNNLGAGDTTVQAALDTIDNLSIGVTSVTGTTPVVSSGGTTPAISIPKATSSADGYLNMTDWSTFNNKGNITGSGTANQIGYFTGANTIAGNNNMTFNATTNLTTLYNLTLTTPLADTSVANGITLDSLTQITTRSHTALSDIGTNTHGTIDTHLAATNPHSDSLNKTLTSANIYVGNATNIATGVAMSGDVAINNAGATVVSDDSHAHTTTTISGIDISADTNLAGDTEIVLTGDNLSIASTITRDTELAPYALLASPIFTTQIVTPLVVGGTATTSDLNLKTTSGVGATGADMHFLVGNNGATEAVTILNSGNVGIASIAPLEKLYTAGNTQTTGEFIEGTGSIVSTAAIIPYIQLSSTANQVPTTTAETLITYTNVDEQQTFAFTPTSGTITIPESGVYFIIAGGQVGKASGVATRLLDLWVKKNGVDVPRSSVRNSIKDAVDTKVVIQNTGIRCVAGDTIKIYIAVDDITGSAGLYATTPGVGPVIPSIIFTMYKISQ